MIGHVAAEARPPRGPDCKAQGGRDGVAQEERMKDGADGRKEEQERVQRESVELRLDFINQFALVGSTFFSGVLFFQV